MKFSDVLVGAISTVVAASVTLYVSGAGRWLMHRRKLQKLVKEQALHVMLAIDIGSSGVRCSAYSIGTSPTLIKGTEQRVRIAIVGAGGAADPLHAIAAVEAAVDLCLSACRALGISSVITAVGFACFAMNLVGLDSSGVPVTRILNYADSHIATAEAVTAIRNALGSLEEHGVELAYQRTGVPCHSAYAPAQLLRWQTETNASKEKPPRVTQWTTLVSAMIGRWTGEKSVPVSYCEGSWTGLMDVQRLSWDKSLVTILSDYGFDSSTLPELADFGECNAVIGETSPFASRWPELIGTKLYLGFGDGACANFGSGACSRDALAVTVGTSAAARVVLSSTDLVAQNASGSIVPKGLCCYRVDRCRYLVLGALTDGGSTVEFVRNLCGFKSEAEFQALLTTAHILPAAGHGLTILPFLSGERAPGWTQGATGVVVGLTRATTPAELLRAFMEAVSYRIAEVAELLSGMLADNAMVIASGTALQGSQCWRQILSDSLDMTVALSTETEATSAGVAYLVSEHQLSAQVQAGEIARTCMEVSQGLVSAEPVPGSVETHAAARTKQRLLYKAINL